MLFLMIFSGHFRIFYLLWLTKIYDYAAFPKAAQSYRRPNYEQKLSVSAPEWGGETPHAAFAFPKEK